MNFAGSFIADCPSEATARPELITEACRALRRNREQYLRNITTGRMIEILSETAASWLQPDYPFRQMTLNDGPSALGFSRATLIRGIDAFFESITEDTLRQLVVQEFGHPDRLDAMVSNTAETKMQTASMATGPELLAHITAGNIPSAALNSMVMGLLLRSAQFLKCARGTSLIPRLFAHSLREAEPSLASCIEIAEWRGGERELEDALRAEVDCITVTGSDETVAELRNRVPVSVRFAGYGHRVSFAFVGKDVLRPQRLKEVTTAIADDVTAWDQLGCLSPHVVFVEEGGRVQPEQLAEALAETMKEREMSQPRGTVSVEDAATITSRRDFYAVRSALRNPGCLWKSEGSTAWTIVFEPEPRFQLSCLNRFLFVQAVSNIESMLIAADSVRRHVSTVGIAVEDGRSVEVAKQLGRWGASRVCPVGQMQRPPITWRHDGRSPLGEIVRWTTLEKGQGYEG